MIEIKFYDRKIISTSQELVDIEINSRLDKLSYYDKLYLNPIYSCFLDFSDDNPTSGNAQIYLAYDNKKIIGFIIGFYTIPWKSQFIPSYVENYKYYISSLYVVKEYQRKKIGTKLINSLIKTY